MSTQKSKILLIEDDSFLAQMYAKKLELEGFEVLLAQDGESGLEIARSRKPNLILLDILLPDRDGFSLMEEAKKDAKISSIPVIMLTNLSQKKNVERGLAMGVRDYLIKAHFMPQEVVDKIKRVIDENVKGKTKNIKFK